MSERNDIAGELTRRAPRSCDSLSYRPSTPDEPASATRDRALIERGRASRTRISPPGLGPPRHAACGELEPASGAAITVKPASFDVLTAEGINDQGVIVGNVFDPAIGAYFGYAATPSGSTANAKQTSTGSGQLTPGATAPKVILPARVRAQLGRQHLLGLHLGGAR